MYIKPWRRKFTAYSTSRYLTERVASQRPVARAKPRAISMNTGSQSISRRRGIRYKASARKTTQEEAARSMTPEEAPAIGTTSLGKYTLEITCMLSTRLREARCTAVEKKPHGRRAARENRGYGTLSDGTLTSLPNTSVSSATFSNGRKKS